MPSGQTGRRLRSALRSSWKQNKEQAPIRVNSYPKPDPGRPTKPSPQAGAESFCLLGLLLYRDIPNYLTKLGACGMATLALNPKKARKGTWVVENQKGKHFHREEAFLRQRQVMPQQSIKKSHASLHASKMLFSSIKSLNLPPLKQHQHLQQLHKRQPPCQDPQPVGRTQGSARGAPRKVQAIHATLRHREEPGSSTLQTWCE